MRLTAMKDEVAQSGDEIVTTKEQRMDRNVKGRRPLGQRVGSVATLAVMALQGAALGEQPSAVGPAEDAPRMIATAIFVVCLAVLTLQTAIGYRGHLRLSLALFLVLFLAATVFDAVDFAGPLMGETNIDSDWSRFTVILVATAFLGGVLAFWTRYLLDLFPVIAVASFIVLLASIEMLQGVRVLLMISAGVAGGGWLYWWREHRRKSDNGGGDIGQSDADE